MKTVAVAVMAVRAVVRVVDAKVLAVRAEAARVAARQPAAVVSASELTRGSSEGGRGRAAAGVILVMDCRGGQRRGHKFSCGEGRGGKSGGGGGDAGEGNGGEGGSRGAEGGECTGRGHAPAS